MILEETFQLVGGIQRVVQYHLGAQLQDGVERRDVLRRVWCHDGDSVTGAHTEGLQASGRSANLTVQLRIRLGAPEEVGGRFIGVDLKVVVVNIQQRGVAVLEVVRCPFRVILEPSL